MHMPYDLNILPLRSCPRIVGSEYVLIVDNPLENGVAMPVLGTSERYKDTVFFWTEDWRLENGLCDEGQILGWLDFRGEAVRDGELAIADVAELKKAVSRLERQVESLRRVEPSEPIEASRKPGKKVSVARGVPKVKRETVKTCAPAPSKREARMLKQIFLDAVS